jgi:methyl-accepting chemotaxis protein
MGIKRPQAGMGFAVVAEEVRNLAQRCAQAAKETSVLIENAANAAGKGTQLTAATQEAFKENIEIAAKIGSAVDEIATTVKEQTQGITQINTAVGQMDKVTQSNAATAEEAAAAAEELNTQASAMKSTGQVLHRPHHCRVCQRDLAHRAIDDRMTMNDVNGIVEAQLTDVSIASCF